MDKIKTYNLTNRISKQAREAFERILDTHMRNKNAYWYVPKCKATERRKAEERFRENNPDVIFVHDNDMIKVNMFYAETCHKVKYNLNVIVNGQKKNITYLKKIFNVK